MASQAPPAEGRAGAAPGARRVAVMSRQLASDAAAGASGSQLSMSPCAAPTRTLPRFDPYILETYLDDLRDIKKKAYDIFKYRPDLLPAVEEGMSKEEHRGLVRRQLHAILEAGFSPLEYFNKDYRKYFYLAECMAMVDLSFMVKMGVQFSLWGGSVVNLGTE